MWPSDARCESNSIWSNPEYHSNRPPYVQMRLDEGIAFEASIVNELRALAGSDRERRGDLAPDTV